MPYCREGRFLNQLVRCPLLRFGRSGTSSEALIACGHSTSWAYRYLTRDCPEEHRTREQSIDFGDPHCTMNMVVGMRFMIDADCIVAICACIGHAEIDLAQAIKFKQVPTNWK